MEQRGRTLPCAGGQALRQGPLGLEGGGDTKPRGRGRGRAGCSLPRWPACRAIADRVGRGGRGGLEAAGQGGWPRQQEGRSQAPLALERAPAEGARGQQARRLPPSRPPGGFCPGWLAQGARGGAGAGETRGRLRRPEGLATSPRRAWWPPRRRASLRPRSLLPAPGPRWCPASGAWGWMSAGEDAANARGGSVSDGPAGRLTGSTACPRGPPSGVKWRVA